MREVNIMKVAIIDADLVYKNKHRFPNLACMKISAYYKSIGADVELKLDYDNLHLYDLVSISKVFIDTEIPYEYSMLYDKTEETVSDYYKNHPILNLPNVVYGGTGFYYDKSPTLPDYIEHIMPDYHLYDSWVQQQLDSGVRRKDLTYYIDYSIGFTTRGCVRRCSYCVNRNYKQCLKHSTISEFVDKERPYICLLDDNIFACSKWRDIFDELESTGKRYQFKQGLDERLLTDEKCEYLFKKSNWIGDRIFAFDNIKDKDMIIDKLKMIRRHTDCICKFYTFCAYNHDNPGQYGAAFYHKDIADLFERIKILMQYRCIPYVMRYKDYKFGPYKSFYNTIAAWCNQPEFFKSLSLSEYANMIQSRSKKVPCAAISSMDKIKSDFPDIAEMYFNMKYEEVSNLGW